MRPPPLRLLLVRHGEVLANRELRHVGSLDEPLSEVGRRQAEGLAEALAPLPLAALYASPLSRAADTGRQIGGRLTLPVRCEPRLAEQRFGEWEGLTRAEIVGRGDGEVLRHWEGDAAVPPPGGEPLVAVQERALELVEELAARHAGEWVALVSHVGPIKTLVCATLGVPLTTARRMFLDPGTVTVIDWSSVPMMRLFNAHGPLDLAGARWASQV
jgi:broad specificity phosphatase PhoE